MSYQQKGSAKLIKLGVILAIFSILVIAVMLMPKGLKDDLSLIGQGSVSVVLVHDKNLVSSAEAMALFNEIRSDYEGKIDFLAVDIETPIGKAFVTQQQVSAVDMVIFGPEGSRKNVLNAAISQSQFRSILNEALSQ